MDGASGASPSARADDPRRIVPFLHTLWWAPLAFVVFALLLLAATPMVVDRRVTALRNGPAYAADRARVLVNDLEAAFGEQLLTSDRTAADAELSRSHFVAQMTFDDDELRRMVEQLGPTTVARHDTLRRLLLQWSTMHAPHEDSASVRLARAVFTAADGLDADIATHSDSSRVRVRRLETLNVISAAVLAPMALAAMTIVFLLARRLQALARQAELERAEVVRAGEARAALLRGVTHDVKNPLGAAAGYAELLTDGIVGPLTPPQRDMVGRIHRLVNVSVSTVTDLLELARADGGLHLEHATVDLATIAREIVDDHDGMARERSLVLAMEESASVFVITDPVRVRQILANLVSNAIKYTPPGGRVTVSLVRADGDPPRTGIEVRDTGPGIPEEVQSQLFDEFFRVHSGTSVVSGNGLGLAISRRLARLLHGDVTFRPGSPSGSVFTLWLEARAPVTSPARDS
jgi:signal transduction histidine kinase